MSYNFKTNQHYMKRCLALAVRYYGQTEPNPVVGALVVKGGKIVGRGAHVRAGQGHAEVVALNEAGEKAKGATIYVTLEPCNHHGRTGPCTEAIIKAGVAKVVFGVSDPNPEASGGGKYLRAKGVEVVGGVLSEEITQWLEPWIFSLKHKRKMIELLAVTALDGSIVDFRPRLVEKYCRKIPNLHSDSARAIFKKAEFDRIILVRTTHNTGSSWPFVDLQLALRRAWTVGSLSFSIYRKENV